MRTIQRLALLGAAAGLALGVVAAMSPATAAPAKPATPAEITAALGEARTAGAYRDAAGTLIVNVTDEQAASAVRAAGATARVVSRSTAQLNQLISQLDRGLGGTAWSVDPISNQVLVQADASVTSSGLAELNRAVAAGAGAVRLTHVSGRFAPLTTGGDAIYGGGYRCSLGFNVRKGTAYYFLTAGHCGDVANTWYANSSQTTVLGDTTGSSFPGNDYAIVTYTNPSITVSGTVGGQDITAAADAYIGESVRRTGSTTGTKSGTVTGLDVTVHYSGGGTVRGMIQTNVCAEPGDSGGPLYDNDLALGLTSGGSGNCRTGGTTFYQPVTEALSKYGVSVF